MLIHWGRIPRIDSPVSIYTPDAGETHCEGKVQCQRTQGPHRRLYILVTRSSSNPSLPTSLDGMLIHWGHISSIDSPVSIYTPDAGETHCEGKVQCQRTQGPHRRLYILVTRISYNPSLPTPLDGMLIHWGFITSIDSPVSNYTPVAEETHCEGKVECHRAQGPRRRLS